MADGRLNEIVALGALSRLDESSDQSRASVDDVEALRKGRELGAGEPRGPSARGKVVALERGARFDAALRDTLKAGVKSVVAGHDGLVDHGEGLR